VNIHLASDMHLEFWHPWHMRPVAAVPECEVLVLAGDILSLRFSDDEMSETWKAFSEKAKAVFYLPGNHEFYGSNLDLGLAVLRRMESNFPSNVKMLWPDEDHIYVHGGRRFLGGTLWFSDDGSNQPYEKFLGDFSHIRGFKPWVYEENKRTKDFLDRNVRQGDVVVTHHLPSERSIAPKYKKSALNRFFVFSCDDLIASAKPALWMHGHTHGGCDYVHGDTRVVCNPMGYPNDVSEYTKVVIDLPEVGDAERANA
jgi:UDP-2,3-diacylglucosamine pyrophosphatase LpxH